MKTAFLMGPVQAFADTAGRAPDDLWRFTFYGFDRATGRDAQHGIGAHGDYASARQAALEKARLLMLAPRLITSTLVTR